MRRWVRVLATVGYLAIGSIALALSVGSVQSNVAVLLQLLGRLLPGLLAAALVAIASWLAFWSDLSDWAFQRVLLWSLSGMGSLGAFAVVVILGLGDGLFLSQGPALILLNTVVGGALAGIGVGLYDVLSRRQRDQLRAEREKLAVLNRMLRHHLLNGMNIVLANAEELERRSDGAPTEELAAIQRRSDEVVALVERVSELTDQVDGRPTLEPMRFDELVYDAVDEVRALYGNDAVKLEGRPPRTQIRGDASLADAVETMIGQRSTSGCRTVLSAEVSGSTAIVRLADSVERATRAQPISDGGDVCETTFRAAEILRKDDQRYATTINQGVDLYMAELLLSRSGGEVRIVEAEETPVIELHVPLA